MRNKFIQNNKNKILEMDGLALLSNLPDNSIDASIFDPQYRAIMDAMKYGNEGARQKKRASLDQMSTDLIHDFCIEIQRVLKPSSYMFLWVDKFTLCEGIHKQFVSGSMTHPSELKLVDMITWFKGSFGQGRRSRRTNEHLLIYQKLPATIASWSDKSIRDSWTEKIPKPRSGHPHRKPTELQNRLIECVTPKKGLILDCCAGSFSTFVSTKETGRDFIGCDLKVVPEYIDERLK